MQLLILLKIKFLVWVLKKKRGRKPAIASLGKQQPGKVTTGQLLGMATQLKKMGRKKGGKLEPMLYNVGPAKSH